MAWEWSHTDEAYQNARDNLSKQSRQWLTICLCEIEAELPVGSGNFDERTYKDYMKAFEGNESPLNVFADSIWDIMSTEIRTCDNGGFNAWACPYGCHTVSFDKE